MAKHPFNGASDEEMIRATSEILTVLTKDPTILSRMVALLTSQDRLQAAYDHHLRVFNEFLQGKVEMAGDLEEARNNTKHEYGLLHGWATLVGPKDPTIPQRLGVVQQQPVTKRSSVQLQQMKDFRVVYQENRMIARATSVKRAKGYEVWVCEGDPSIESNWRYLCNCTRVNHIELAGLTPGKLYYLRIRAMMAKGSGPWSNFVSMIAI